MKHDYIAIEGVDGVGKTTLWSKLATIASIVGAMEGEDLGLRFITQPSNTLPGRILRESFSAERLDPSVEACLFALDRLLSAREHEGHCIISDRSWWSSLVYQGLDEDDVMAVNALVPAQFTIYLRVEPDAAFDLLSRKTGELDAMELVSKEEVKRRVKVYDDLALEHPDSCVVVDASMSAKDVLMKVVDVLFGDHEFFDTIKEEAQGL